MKILLAQTGTKFGAQAPGVPYSQLTLASSIEDAADVKITGCTSNGLFPTNDEIMKQVEDFRPDVVGLTIEYAIATSNNIALARQIRQFYPGIRIIAGGHQATFISHDLLKSGLIDAIFIGEGESSLRKYAIEGDFAKIPGVRYMKNSEVVDTGLPQMVDLNELNPPAYHLLPKGVKLIMGIESSRGCPYSCNYCETRHFWGSGLLRKMSARNFIRNLKHALDYSSGFNFFLVDDCFTADMEGHVQEICSALIAEAFSINIMIQARVDNLAQNLEILPRFKKAGMGTVILGIESIYQQTLSEMNKRAGYGQQQIKDLLKGCQDNGLKTFVSVIFGYPNETEEMILRTADFLMENNVSTVSMSIATPLPGSDLYKQAQENGEILSRDYNLYDYAHRVWSKIPNYTVDTVNIARRRFYLRPDYIEKTLNNIMGNSEIDLPGLQMAAMLNFEVNNPLLSGPRTHEELLMLLAGLKRVLAKQLQSTGNKYNKVIRFQVESISLYLTIKNGILTEIDDPPEIQDDFYISTDLPTFVDLFCGFEWDILSALVCGKVKVSDRADIIEISDFILWFVKIQRILQWQAEVQREIKILPARLNEWINADEDRRSYFNKVFFNESGLFLHTGKKKVGGLSFNFETPTKLVDSVFLGKKPKNNNFELIVDGQQMKAVLQGNILLLCELLQSPRLKLVSQRSIRMKEPGEYFDFLENNFNPALAENFEITVQYVLENESSEKELWWLKIGNKKLSVGRDQLGEKALIKIKMKKTHFLELINGRTHPVKLLTTGKMFVEGNPLTLMRMDKCFKETGVIYE